MPDAMLRILSGRPNALDIRFTLYYSSEFAQIINNKLYFLISPGKVAYQQQNLININFGMTNAPFMLFSIAKNIFIAVTCC
jgi:hypothetical protein